MAQTSCVTDHEGLTSHERSLPEFDLIFREFERPIYNYLLGLTQNQADAEDLTQETFIRVYDKLGTFRGEASLSTWVYRVATNASIDHFRSRAHRQAKVTQSLEEPQFQREWVDNNMPAPDHQFSQSQMSDCVQGFIQCLPLSYRTVVLLHDLQGLKVQEISDILNLPLATVKIRVHRARNKLRASLNAGCDLAHDEGNVLVCEPNMLSTGT